MTTKTVDLQKAALKDSAARAIELLGGPVEAMRKVEAPTYQSVQSWALNGVPPKYCMRIKELTGMSLSELRPTDWTSYWPTPSTPAQEAAHG